MRNHLPNFLEDSQRINGLPTGLITQVEPHHREFLNSEFPIKYLLLKISYAKRLLQKGYTADTYFGPDYSVITTSTVYDNYLKSFNWKEERDIVLQFEPDFHIPTDYPVYLDMAKEDRMKNTIDCMEGTKWMAKELFHTKTRVLPLIKGASKEERKVCYETFEDLGINYCVFYGTQFFTGGLGNNINLLKQEIRKVTSEFSRCAIFIIGLLSPRYLTKLPPHVIAAAGLMKWLTVKKNSDNSHEFNKALLSLKEKVEKRLGKGQMTLGNFKGGHNG